MSSSEKRPYPAMEKQVSFSDRETVIVNGNLESMQETTDAIDPVAEEADDIEKKNDSPTLVTNASSTDDDSSKKPLYASDPEQWLKNVTRTHEYVCIVIFRGHWCSYDHAYLTEFGELNTEHMKKRGVYLIAWTSEGEEGAKLADEHWHLKSKYEFDEVIGDETGALGQWLKEDELLPNLITSSPVEAQVAHKITSGTYPNGIVQPGIAFYAHHGILVMHWEAKVLKPTYGGAHRPAPSEIWSRVKHRKHALDDGNAAMPINGETLKQTCEKLDGNCNVM